MTANPTPEAVEETLTMLGSVEAAAE